MGSGERGVGSGEWGVGSGGGSGCICFIISSQKPYHTGSREECALASYLELSSLR